MFASSSNKFGEIHVSPKNRIVGRCSHFRVKFLRHDSGSLSDYWIDLTSASSWSGSSVKGNNCATFIFW